MLNFLSIIKILKNLLAGIVVVLLPQKNGNSFLISTLGKQTSWCGVQATYFLEKLQVHILPPARLDKTCGMCYTDFEGVKNESYALDF